jgi:hypothetical protein
VAAILTLALLAVLLCFVVWDRRKLSNAKVEPLSRASLRNGWSPTQQAKWVAPAAISVVTFALGLLEWLQPSKPPFTGKWSDVKHLAVMHMGSAGLAFLWWLLTIALLVFALLAWVSSQPTRK